MYSLSFIKNYLNFYGFKLIYKYQFQLNWCFFNVQEIKNKNTKTIISFFYLSTIQIY